MEKELNNLISLMQDSTQKDRDLIEHAFLFAKEKHKDQKRNSGEPYFTHLIATAKKIADLHMSATAIAAGILHDSVEDTDTTLEEIEKEFGKEIAFLVDGVTKLGRVRYHGTDRHNESLRKLFVAMSQDIRVLIIKLCDRLHNMETLHFVPKEKQKRIAEETLQIYAPIAYRLGIRKISRQLEDLAFPYIEPESFAEIQKLIKERYKDQTDSLDKFRKSVTKSLVKSGVKEFKTSYRVKGIYSLYKKLKTKKDIEKIYDIRAMRILVEKSEDCYKILGIIHSEYQPLPGRIKDYIAFPKENGYQGLHTTVFTGDGSIVEVQIRTEEMDKESEYGIASHISYKSTSKKNSNLNWIYKILPKNIIQSTDPKDKEKLKDVPEWVRNMVKYQNENKHEDDIANTLEEIKEDFFSERIFVFTPKGDVIDLPAGCSVIDFAYSIHSDIGNHISGAKINGKMTSIESEIKNGDIVEILTNKNAKPNRKWLESVKTTFAKKNIRSLGH